MTGNRLARNRRVRRDDPVDAGLTENAGERTDGLVGEIGRDFDDDRHVLATVIGLHLLALLLETPNQLAAGIGVLEVAQSFGVR